MTLQAAEIHKATADGVEGIDYDNSIMNAIEAELSNKANAREYLATFEFAISGDVVRQPDASTIPLDLLITGLKTKNYDVSHFIKNGTLHLHVRFNS